jgi:thermostable 8-oxoguanine DNA glycosylase
MEEENKDVLYEIFTETTSELSEKLKALSGRYTKRGEALISSTRKMRVSLKAIDELEEEESLEMEGLETELLGGEKVEEEPQMRLETDPNHPNYNTMQPV